MENKKFDDWVDVNECNECGHYWSDACDGTPLGLERPCRVFKATRKMDIPEQLRKVREEVKDVRKFSRVFAVMFILHLIVEVVGG